MTATTSSSTIIGAHIRILVPLLGILASKHDGILLGEGRIGRHHLPGGLEGGEDGVVQVGDVVAGGVGGDDETAGAGASAFGEVGGGFLIVVGFDGVGGAALLLRSSSGEGGTSSFLVGGGGGGGGAAASRSEGSGIGRGLLIGRRVISREFEGGEGSVDGGAAGERGRCRTGRLFGGGFFVDRGGCGYRYRGGCRSGSGSSFLVGVVIIVIVHAGRRRWWCWY
mmetsp:Transcript_1580/g.3079  ORF Transcript_1580/g.3079 Transcript_1580/m.3079 type:complete len:224 (+) Transcript_1580:748-1419(+)